ncbi:hypothetical protein CMI41_02655 [Candidatus Pacearchaeota archaeon]|nr:hypothetical protein [Candidatus Pacearchaeota archaeon]|tara:strand:- start:18068 stop:18964 length:897 start_codon:yes stop_codon:yes gene_type:complete
MNHFPFIKIENRDYPSVIMGEDKFTGWFEKDSFGTEEQRGMAYKEAIETAYVCGVRGFSMSPQPTLVAVLKKFKKTHPEIVCISNHHWQTHYYIGNKSLWSKENLDRIFATEKYHSDPDLIKGSYWFKDVDNNKRFSKEEIETIRLDEKEYIAQLKEFGSFCDFCLVGNYGKSTLLTIGREDIIKKEIKLARKAGLVPLGMCEGGGLALPKMEQLDVGGHWAWINRQHAHPNLSYTLDVIKKIKKPITAYKVFTSSEGFNFEESIKLIRNIPQIKSIVVGIEDKEQARETFSNLKKQF